MASAIKLATEKTAGAGAQPFDYVQPSLISILFVTSVFVTAFVARGDRLMVLLIGVFTAGVLLANLPARIGAWRPARRFASGFERYFYAILLGGLVVTIGGAFAYSQYMGDGTFPDLDMPFPQIRMLWSVQAASLPGFEVELVVAMFYAKIMIFEIEPENFRRMHERRATWVRRTLAQAKALASLLTHPDTLKWAMVVVAAYVFIAALGAWVLFSMPWHPFDFTGAKVNAARVGHYVGNLSADLLRTLIWRVLHYTVAIGYWVVIFALLDAFARTARQLDLLVSRRFQLAMKPARKSPPIPPS